MSCVIVKELPQIRFVRAWQTYRVGDVIQPPGTLRQWLIASGFCEFVKPASSVPVASEPEPPVTVPAKQRKPRKGN